jgi:hypothetical protein
MGSENRRVSFFIEPDFELIFGEVEPSSSAVVPALFPDPVGRYDFMKLTRQTGLSAKGLSEQLWQGVWSSSIVNDSFGSVRKGLETQFEIPDVVAQSSSSSRRARRSGYGAWRGALPLPGNWYALARP